MDMDRDIHPQNSMQSNASSALGDEGNDGVTIYNFIFLSINLTRNGAAVQTRTWLQAIINAV